MKCILCGTVVPAEYEDKIPQLSNAANRFLLNFTNEIKKSFPMNILSYMGIDVPTKIKKELKRKKSSVNDTDYFFKTRFKVGGIITYWHAVRREIKKADCIIAYNPIYAYLNVPYLTRIYGKKSVLILADYSPEEAYKEKRQKLYAALQLKAINKYDIVIGLSQNIKRYLTERQKFIYMQGGIDSFVFDYFGQEILSSGSDKVIFMYAGTLEKVTGIDLLLEAFKRVKYENAELWISGKGSMLNLVKDAALKDGRIRYLGCPPYLEYLNNLKKASILVNPRNMNLPENKNNFPSKILEYLATGKPIVSSRFSGWENFSEEIIFCESSVSGFEEEIRKLCIDNYQKDDMLYKKNRKFAEQFIWKKQIEKVFYQLL